LKIQKGLFSDPPPLQKVLYHLRSKKNKTCRIYIMKNHMQNLHVENVPSFSWPEKGARKGHLRCVLKDWL
jgi:hypothetical protein